MTLGSAGPFGAISTRIGDLTNETTINNATKLHNYHRYVIRIVSFEVGCWVGPNRPFSGGRCPFFPSFIRSFLLFWPCAVVVPKVVHRLHRRWNRNSLSHKELNSLWLRLFRFVFRWRTGTTFGTTTAHDWIAAIMGLRSCGTKSGTRTSSGDESK
jgi:hypothetical protein